MFAMAGHYTRYCPGVSATRSSSQLRHWRRYCIPILLCVPLTGYLGYLITGKGHQELSILPSYLGQIPRDIRLSVVQWLEYTPLVHGIAVYLDFWRRQYREIRHEKASPQFKSFPNQCKSDQSLYTALSEDVRNASALHFHYILSFHFEIFSYCSKPVLGIFLSWRRSRLENCCILEPVSMCSPSRLMLVRPSAIHDKFHFLRTS